MKLMNLPASLGRLVSDERGGEVVEWALVAGLVVIAAIVVIGSVGTKVLARWNTVNNGL
jgi:Flp pilus assembly pilin Flp